MPAIQEITTSWTVTGAAPGTSVMYFDATSTVDSSRDALETLWSAADFAQAIGTVWKVATSGRVLDVETGNVISGWADGRAKEGNAGSSDGPVPDVAQALFRWRTDGVVDNRFVQGRTFLPGIGTGYLAGGKLSGSAMTVLNGAVTNFMADNGDFVIWHRPKAGAGGAIFPVELGTVWDEFSYLRRRRT